MLRRWTLPLLATAALVGFLLAPARPAASQDITPVVVTNWPKPQQVEGKVSITGTVRLAEQVVFRDVTVPPVSRSETTRLVSAGTLATGGFARVVLSLQGQVKGMVQREGEVGALLLPSESSIRDAFNEQGLTLFALDVVMPRVTARTPWFASPQPDYKIGFAEYEVLLYNTTDKAVTVNLFAYMTN